MQFSFDGGKLDITISPSVLEKIAKEFKNLSEEYLKCGNKDFVILSNPTSGDGKWSLNLTWKPEYDSDGKIINL